jgi:hypothetical protein
MKHPACRDLYAYWTERRGARARPDRADIEPGDIRHLLGDTFILAIDTHAGHPFRLAGTRACALFGRELRGQAFVDLWAAASRQTIRDIVEVVMAESVGTVAGVSACNDAGTAVDLEILLLPLGGRGPSHVRAIGVLAPLARPDWLGANQLGALVLGHRRHVGPVVETRGLPRFMAATGRLRRGLVVHQGGRTS